MVWGHSTNTEALIISAIICSGSKQIDNSDGEVYLYMGDASKALTLAVGDT